MSYSDTVVEYEPVTKMGAAYAKVLFDIWNNIGRPDDLTTNSGWKLLDEIIRVWEASFPQEVMDWVHDRAIDLEAERTIQQHIASGGYNPVTYPPTLFHLIKIMLPKLKMTDKRVHRQICQRYPKLFQTTNYAI